MREAGGEVCCMYIMARVARVHRAADEGGRAMAYFRTNIARSLVCLGISANILASGRATANVGGDKV